LAALEDGQATGGDTGWEAMHLVCAMRTGSWSGRCRII